MNRRVYEDRISDSDNSEISSDEDDDVKKPPPLQLKRKEPIEYQNQNQNQSHIIPTSVMTANKISSIKNAISLDPSEKFRPTSPPNPPPQNLQKKISSNDEFIIESDKKLSKSPSIPSSSSSEEIILPSSSSKEEEVFEFEDIKDKSKSPSPLIPKSSSSKEEEMVFENVKDKSKSKSKSSSSEEEAEMVFEDIKDKTKPKSQSPLIPKSSSLSEEEMAFEDIKDKSKPKLPSSSEEEEMVFEDIKDKLKPKPKSSSSEEDEMVFEDISKSKSKSKSKVELKPIQKIAEVINRDEIVSETCKRTDSRKCSINKAKLEMEKQNSEELEQMAEGEYDFLYPSLDDPNFLVKIAKKKEFNDTKYDAIIADVKKHSEELNNIEYGLLPQQAFVRNFLSFQTPYNSLLLFHGLGSGKTCSAIGVCEEMREYLMQMGINKKIIIVASPNVQDNFRLQLFDERKLKQVDGMWNISGCISNKLLKEVNISNSKEITREIIINSVKKIIDTYYEFYGYIQFANEIDKYIENKETVLKDADVIKKLQHGFSDRLIVIDEVHNIRIDKENSNKNITKNLMLLVSIVSGIRLLLLSATPMFNNYSEIIWLLNLMNANDKRSIIHVSDVFNKNGSFKTDKSGNEIGKELLIRKATGYISYVRGENPYTFPFRVYPNVFSKDNTFLSTEFYPKYQLNGKKIAEETKIKKLSIYLTQIGKYQEYGYKYVIDDLRKKKSGQKRGFKEAKAFGYSDLQMPIEALNIIYPYEGLEQLAENIENVEYVEEEEDIDDIENVVEMNDTIGGAFSDEDISDESSNEEISDESSVEMPKEEEEEPEDEQENISDESSGDESSGDESSIEMPEEEEEEPKDEEEEEEKEYIFEEKPVTKTVTKKGKALYKIDPKELVGKQGLKRVMKYENTNKPLFKGNFSYKKGFDKIFHPDEIGKYSSKIQAICNQIYNSDTGVVSDGIIIIYSNYIDGGLVPVALALEEMGFTRFKSNSLFEKAPTPSVDVRTMKPPTNKADFKPAKYTMITGDPKLSRDNNSDMKYITSDENISGENIKVVLLSQAGSEGLDFKGIRQIHIMEPWYNINRLEQIIGRGVRNGSHKLLSFEERNVMLFLHGTLNGFNPEEESADLYIYRSTELKAVKIGKTARILKETSVDCLINYNQTLLTNENLNKIEANRNITQQLSTGQIINNFQVGDIDNSVTCDFMTCEYKCAKHVDISDEDVNVDTYNETFIKSNSDKIINRIKQLMKEKFFYIQKDFIGRINYQKNYPIEQVNSAITQMIEDPTEIILDKYGRTGNLINLGQYYLFQPTEIDYPGVSIYERSVPINFKHDDINFEIKHKALHNVNDKRGIYENIKKRKEEEEEEEEEEVEIEFESKKNLKKSGESLMSESSKPSKSSARTKYTENIKKSIKYNKTEILKKYHKIYKIYTTEGQIDVNATQDEIDNNYIFKYMIDDDTIIKLSDKNDRINIVSELIIRKMFDLLTLENKINIINSLEIDMNDEDSTDESYVFFINSLKEYLSEKIINENGIIGIFFSIGKNKNKDLKYFVKNDMNNWVEALPQDRNIINNSELYKSLNINKYNLSEYLGFIGIQNKKEDSYLFKLKKNNTAVGKNKASKGFSCSTHNKQKLLDDIVAKFNIKYDGTPKINDANKRKFQPKDLCILTELTYRYYQKIKYDDILWFVSTEFATINNFEEKEK